MLNKYNILFDIKKCIFFYLDLDYLFEVKFLFKFRFYFNYPLLSPRHDTFFFYYFFLNLYSKYFIYILFEFGCGIGTIFSFFYNLYKIYYVLFENYFLNIKFLNFNFKFLKKKYILFCNWNYVLHNFKKINIIFSNPPYISLNDMFLNFDMIHSFKLSLFSLFNGFFLIYNIVYYSYDLLFFNGIILLEHGYFQSKKIRNFMFLCGYLNICSYFDYNFLFRFIFAEK